MKNGTILRLFFFGCCLAILTSFGGEVVLHRTHQQRLLLPDPRGVKVTVTDTTITSSQTTFNANAPYYFTATNQEHSPHSFIIRERPRQGIIQPQSQKGILYIVPSTQLPHGATKSFRFAFPDATGQSTSPQGNNNSVQFTAQLTNGNGVEIPVKVMRG